MIKWKKVVVQRLTNLEQVNHADAIKESVQAYVMNEVKNQLPKFLSKAVFDYVQPRLERTLRDVLKNKKRSFLAHDKHLELYNALMNSMVVDKSAAKGREGEKMLVGLHPRKAKLKKNLHTMKETLEELPVQNWFNKHVDAEDELEENEFINDLVIMFGKCMKKYLNKDKITKEDLKGLTFELLKGRFKNSVELE
ncbi:hypothetical protein Tco_0228823 [Tanacetum coccineum]